MTYPFVTIIIPMHNAEETIEKCLKSLFNLEYPKDRFEVVIVDNNSTDSSAVLSQKYPVTLLKKSSGTIAAVRNYGANHSKGEIFGFVDSDCVAYEDWLISAVRVLSDPGVAATGSEHLCPENSTWVEKSWLFESKHKPFQIAFIPSGNFLIKADIFRKIGGFNENLTTCEDVEIGLRLTKSGHRMIESSEVRMIHLRNSKTIINFFKKEVWYGTNLMDTLKFKYLNKVFIISLLFFFGHIGLIAGMILWIKGDGTKLILESGFTILFLIFISALYRVKRSKKYALFFHTLCLYYFYFAGRTVGMINRIYNGIEKRLVS